MDTDIENLCCTEVPRVDSYLENGQCVTKHEFFHPWCINTWCLHFCHELHQKIRPTTLRVDDRNAKLRYAAYRNFVQAIWGKLPKGHRKVIPACVVKAIRDVYSNIDELYTYRVCYGKFGFGLKSDPSGKII